MGAAGGRTRVVVELSLELSDSPEAFVARTRNQYEVACVRPVTSAPVAPPSLMVVVVEPAKPLLSARSSTKPDCPLAWAVQFTRSDVAVTFVNPSRVGGPGRVSRAMTPELPDDPSPFFALTRKWYVVLGFRPVTLLLVPAMSATVVTDAEKSATVE